MVEENTAPKRKYRALKRREKWTAEEHRRFLEALDYYGRDWMKITQHVVSKTRVQVRSHAQKYFLKLEKVQKQSGRAPIPSSPTTPVLEQKNDLRTDHFTLSGFNSLAASEAPEESSSSPLSPIMTGATQSEAHNYSTPIMQDSSPLEESVSEADNNMVFALPQGDSLHDETSSNFIEDFLNIDMDITDGRSAETDFVSGLLLPVSPMTFGEII